jgi:hypothetical protein
VKAAEDQRTNFAARYMPADVNLLAYEDAHGNLSGPATKPITVTATWVACPPMMAQCSSTFLNSTTVVNEGQYVSLSHENNISPARRRYATSRC